MHITRLLFTLFIILFIGQIHADDSPLQQWWHQKSTSASSNVSRKAACEMFTETTSSGTVVTYTWNGSQCIGSRGEISGVVSASCPTGSTKVFTNLQSGPNGSYYDNSLCRFSTSCTAPQVRQSDGSCAAPPPECEPGCNGACGQQKTFNRLRTLACIDQCIYRLGGGMEIELANGQSRAYMTVQNNTGASCTPEQETTTPDPTPCPECECQNKGQSYVVMAGVATCVAPGTPGSEPIKKQDPPKVETHTPAPTPENPNPEPEVTETPSPIITITPAPAGSPPGTGPTITETTANADGSSTSTAQGQDKFCQANPNHALCKADDAKKFCEENPDVLACQKLDEPGEGEAIGEKTIDLGFSPVDVPGATGGSCPAPVTISIGGRSASLSWDWLCQYAAGVKPAVLAVAWLSAALIVFGAVRERD